MSSLTLFAHVTGPSTERRPRALADRSDWINDLCLALLHRAAEEGLPMCAHTLERVPPGPACDVCGRRPARPLSFSYVAPASFPRCLRCERARIEPESIFHLVHDLAHDLGTSHLSGVRTRVDGQLLDWDGWLALRGLTDPLAPPAADGADTLR